jgi:hypothetical protein
MENMDESLKQQLAGVAETFALMKKRPDGVSS